MAGPTSSTGSAAVVPGAKVLGEQGGVDLTGPAYRPSILPIEAM